MKKVILLTVLWGGLVAAAECRMVATVEPAWNGDKRVPADKLLTVRISEQQGCGRHVTEYLGHVQTVETKRKHAMQPGDTVTLRSLERTPHGRLLVEVVSVGGARCNQERTR